MELTYSFKSELWVYGGDAAWYFVTLPTDQADQIRSLTASSRKLGFGSVKVTAIIRGLSWDTSIFPDTKSKSYVLPIKKEVRKRLSIDVGNEVAVKIVLKDVAF